MMVSFGKAMVSFGKHGEGAAPDRRAITVR